MKKRINLYQENCYPIREKLQFSHFFILFFVCIALSASSYFMANRQANSLNAQLVVHKTDINHQQSVLSDLTVKLDLNKAPDAQYRRHLILKNEVAAKQRLLTSISSIDVQELVSFSELMRGLSYANMPHLSIQHFSMIEGDLNITGNAKYSDSVPLWLSNIQVTKELSKVKFNALSIKQKQGFFTFQLTNRTAKEKVSE